MFSKAAPGEDMKESCEALQGGLGHGMQVQGVTKFVANRNLPVALKEDISRHLEGSQVIRNEQGEGDVFSRLSHTLQVSLPLPPPSLSPLLSII